MATNKPLSSVGRALRIIEYLAGHSTDGVALATLSKDLKINKATAHSTLATLREYDWVEQVPTTGHYRLGNGIGSIANHKTAHQRLAETLHPTLVAISSRFNELVHLGTLKGQHIIYLDKVEPDRPIRVVSRIGRQASAVRTSLGRALIGSLPDREEALAWFMTDPDLDSLSPSSRLSIEHATRENFARLDELGWTQEIGEFEEGIACVSIPLTINGNIDVAISISTPLERMGEAQRPLFAQGMAEEIAKIPAIAKITAPLPLSTRS